MEALYYLFKNTDEHIFPFELLEYFDLVAVRELGDVASKRTFREIVFNEKAGNPTAYLQRRFEDFPMNGSPVAIVFQRNLTYHPEHGLSYCRDYADLASQLRVRQSIKRFLSNGYGTSLRAVPSYPLLQGIA